MVDTESFDWDAANIEHAALHGVEPEEAEEALLDPGRYHIGDRTVSGERRRVFLGQTTDGRVIVVVYTRRGRWIRVVAARDATPGEVRNWQRQRR